MITLDLPIPPSLSLLYVEDDPIARETTARILALKFPALELHCASDGTEGLARFRESRPDIVLTDIAMPGLSGINMAREILEADRKIPIILISAHSELPFLLEGIRLGIRHYVLKPVEYEVLFGAVADCISRVEQERQLSRQDQCIRLLSEVVEQSSSLIAVADRGGVVRYVNRKFSGFTGYPADELLERHLRQLHFAEESVESSFDLVWAEISSGREWRGEGVNRKRCGEVYHESVSIAPIFDLAGEISHFVTVREDITAKKKSQEKMDRAQKLESLGMLAGGIAHDFNNILTGVLGNISYARRLTESEALQWPLKEAEEASECAADLARQFLTFARGGKPVKKQVTVGSLVEASVSLALRGTNIQAEVALTDGLDSVEVDVGQIHLAFNSILINAAQAMPGGGTVLVGARNARLDEGNEVGLPPGSYVRFTFSELGDGVPEEIRDKIFDPYFSTRSDGSGLGLATAYSIFARHGGHLGLDRPERGATFVGHLPSLPAFQVVAPRKKALPGAASPGRPVLLMDDDPIVVKVATKMFETLGYPTTTCVNGEEAIELYRQAREAGKPYGTTIVDLTVAGGMGGMEAAQQILTLDPEARLVVSSGYFDDPVMADHREYGFAAVLPKPYKVADLVELMDELRACPEGDGGRAISAGAPPGPSLL